MSALFQILEDMVASPTKAIERALRSAENSEPDGHATLQSVGPM